MDCQGREEEEDGSTEKKREPLSEKLLRRENLRKQEVSRKREEVENTKASTEKVDYFRATLAEKCSKIDEALSALTPNDENNKGDLPHQFDVIGKDVTSLQRYIASSTLFVKVYEVRRAQEQVQVLEQRFRQLEEKLLPKKKFGFKSRKVTAKKQEIDTTDSTLDTKPPICKLLSEHLYIDRSTGFSHRKGENLILTHQDIFQKDVALTSLEDCTVQLLGAASTLHIMSLKNCKVFSGPVSTSVFIDNCTDCKFLLPCQQLRVHNTKLCDFYLHVKSRAIIEDTKQVRFAPYNWSYENIESHFDSAGLEMNTNHWDSIDDFNWLASDKPSPNWQIMNESERVIDWNVTDN